MRHLDRKLDFLAGIPAGGRVLDIGCGNMPYLGYFHRFRGDVEFYGVDVRDLSEALPAGVREFHVCDITSDNLPFPDAYFDGFYSSHVVEHLGTYENISAFLRESMRVVAPGGRGYLETPSARSLRMPSWSAFPWEKSGPINFYDDPTHNLFVEERKMSDLLARNDCTIHREGIYRNWMIAGMILPLPVMAFLIPRRYTAAIVKHVVGWSRFWIVEKRKTGGRRAECLLRIGPRDAS